MLSGGVEEFQESHWLDYYEYYWDPSRYFSQKNQLMPDHKLSIEHQRRLNPPMQEVVKKEIIKWLDAGVTYPIADNS